MKQNYEKPTFSISLMINQDILAISNVGDDNLGYWGNWDLKGGENLV